MNDRSGPQGAASESTLGATDISLQEALAALVGERYEGGCPFCEAYIEIVPDTLIIDGVEHPAPGMFTALTRHDDWCPWWRRYQAGDRDA